PSTYAPPRAPLSFPTRRSSDLFVLKSKLGVRGFPTIVMVNEDNKGVKVVGSRPLDFYVSALKQVSDKEELKANKLPALSELLAKDRKSTRLNSSHVKISYAVFC